ncbi:MAG: helix-turn-helix domain-containing protein [Desulfosporosinus sp.]|nr:helix-turn-helix domain-containing protein [Desulfosporosinus sp.]
MSRSSECYLSVKELGRYLRISYDKAINLANSPDFPVAIIADSKVFPKDQIVAWAEQRINPSLFASNATGNAKRVKIRNKA